MAAVGGAGDGRPSTAMQVDDVGEWPPLTAGTGNGKGETKALSLGGSRNSQQQRDGVGGSSLEGSISRDPRLQRSLGVLKEARRCPEGLGKLQVRETSLGEPHVGSGSIDAMDVSMVDGVEGMRKTSRGGGEGSDYPPAFSTVALGRSGPSHEAAGTMEGGAEGTWRSSPGAGDGSYRSGHSLAGRAAAGNEDGVPPGASGTTSFTRTGSYEGKKLGSMVLSAGSPPYERLQDVAAASTLRGGALGTLDRAIPAVTWRSTQGVRRNDAGRNSEITEGAMAWAEQTFVPELTEVDSRMEEATKDVGYEGDGAALEESPGELHASRQPFKATGGSSNSSRRAANHQGKATGTGLNNSKSSVDNAWTRPQVMALTPQDELGELTNDGITLQLDEGDVKSTLQQFEGAIVGRLFGRRLPFSFLYTELKKRWEKFGHFRIITISNDCFVCLFDNHEVRDSVLMGGPWIVAGQVLGLDKWSPSFSPSSLEGFITPVWIRLPSLPLYCWGSQNLSRIAAMIGEPMWADATTHRLERGSFARICVRVDLSKALSPGIWIQGLQDRFFQPIVYEGLSMFCFHCGHVGHRESQCNIRPQVVKEGGGPLSQPVPMMQQEAATGGESSMHSKRASALEGQDGTEDHDGAKPAAKDDPEDDHHGYGPWMVVTHKPRPNRGPRPSRNSGGSPAITTEADSRSSPREGPHVYTSPPHMGEETTPLQEEGLPPSVRPPSTVFLHQEDNMLVNIHHGRGSASPPAQAVGGGMELVVASPSYIPISPHTSSPGGRRSRRKRDGLSQKFIDRLVSNLGPTAAGVRKKKKASNFVGGDASPLPDS